METTIKKANSNSKASKSDVLLPAKTVPVLLTSQSVRPVWMALQWIIPTPLAKNVMMSASLVPLPTLQIALHVTLDGPSNQLTQHRIHAPNALIPIVGFARLSKLAQHAKIPFLLDQTVNALDASQIAKFVLIISPATNVTMDTL
jgi:hypothetical protein